MESHAKLLGHPIHQMLIPLPAGLFIVAAVLDIIGAFVSWSWLPTVTFWNVAFGIGTAVLAAIFGAIDWSNIPQNTRAKRIATLHGGGNLVAVLLFAGALWLRSHNQVDYRAGGAALALEIVALALLGVTAWLGGELVDRLGIGVDDGANLDAPSSLAAKHARPRA